MDILLFKILKSLCEDFPSLNPFIIRETDAEEVFSLLKRRRKYVLSEQNNAQQNTNNNVNNNKKRRRIDPREATWL
jgi:hypothetical protein